jgi:hypothetical protein
MQKEKYRKFERKKNIYQRVQQKNKNVQRKTTQKI